MRNFEGMEGCFVVRTGGFSLWTSLSLDRPGGSCDGEKCVVINSVSCQFL